MKLTKPSFYDSFICIADRCTDNCCIGWEIDIDDRALERFSAVGGDFGKRLCAAIHERDSVHTFAFGEGERCALLREDGLCELILHCGEDALCDICALHPRFFGWFNGLKEAGLGLCCEEVCRLLFADSAPLTFLTQEIDEPWEETCSDELLELLLTARGELFALLQDRSRPLNERLFAAAQFTRALQEALDNGTQAEYSRASTLPEYDLHETLRAVTQLFSQMESVGAAWDDTLRRLTERCGDIAREFPQFMEQQHGELWRYDHIAVYFCYRYFLDGVFLGEVVSRTGMMCLSVLAVAMMDCLTWIEKGTLSEWDRVLNIKLYSKQVEYSVNNVELVYDAVWDVAELSPERLAAVFGT